MSETPISVDPSSAAPVAPLNAGDPPSPTPEPAPEAQPQQPQVPAGYIAEDKVRSMIDAEVKAQVEGLKESKTKILDEKKTVEQQSQPWLELSKNLGVSPEEAGNILRAVQESKTAELFAKGDIEGAIKPRVQAVEAEWQGRVDVLENQNNDLQTENQTLRNRLSEVMKGERLLRAANDAKLTGTQAETAVDIMSKVFKLSDDFTTLEPSVDGQAIYNPEKSDEKMTPSAFIKHRMRKEHWYLWGAPQGAGDSNPGAPQNGSGRPTDWNKMTPAQQALAARDNPELANKHAPTTNRMGRGA